MCMYIAVPFATRCFIQKQIREEEKNTNGEKRAFTEEKTERRVYSGGIHK